MTTRNNYNKSSSGTDIEATCYYDTFRSQSDFNDNIQILQYAGYRATSKGYYIDNGNLPDADSITFLVKGTREDKIKFLVAQGLDNLEADISEDDLDIEVKGFMSDKPSLVTFENLNKYDLKDTNLEIMPDKNLIKLETRGYSQGDYAEVFYCPEDCEKVWGNAPVQKAVQRYIDHYYWDSPIYAAVTVNGEEYSFYDMPEYDEYSWDKAAFLEYVAKESGIDKETIEPYLPNNPDYL